MGQLLIKIRETRSSALTRTSSPPSALSANADLPTVRADREAVSDADSNSASSGEPMNRRHWGLTSSSLALMLVAYASFVEGPGIGPFADHAQFVVRFAFGAEVFAVLTVFVAAGLSRFWTNVDCLPPWRRHFVRIVAYLLIPALIAAFLWIFWVDHDKLWDQILEKVRMERGYAP
jgi:hypothetical protein